MLCWFKPFFLQSEPWRQSRGEAKAFWHGKASCVKDWMSIRPLLPPWTWSHPCLCESLQISHSFFLFPETGPPNSILYIARTAEAEAFWEHSLLSRLNVRLKPLRILMLNPNPLKNNIWSGAFEKWLGHKVTGHQQLLLPVTHKCQWAEAEIQSLKLCFIQRDSNLWRPWINTLISLPASSLVPCALLAVMWGGRGGGRSCQSWYLGFHLIIPCILPSFSGRLGSDTSRNGQSS